jgi:antitoxin component of MazEF toxin-antitoxin module
MNRKVFKTGHSFAVTLSKKILEELGLKNGDAVEVELDKDKGQIIIRQGRRGAQLALELHLRHKLGAVPSKK